MDTSPPVNTRPSPEMAIQGRQQRAQLAMWRLLVVVALIALLWTDYTVRSRVLERDPTWREFQASPEFRGVAALAVLCLILFVLRRIGIKQFADTTVPTEKADLTPRSEEQPVPGGTSAKAQLDTDGASGSTVLACSGGGIKSASFCLGALQELDARGRFGEVETVVAVSGGGYAASAYLAMYQHLDSVGLEPEEGGTPFAPGSAELAELRRRTNIVTSPGRARFDLVTSLLFGIGVNVILLAAGVMALAWVMAEHVVLTQMVDTNIRTHSSLWALNGLGWDHWWAELLGPLLLVGLAVLLFCGQRLHDYVASRAEDRRAADGHDGAHRIDPRSTLRARGQGPAARPLIAAFLSAWQTAQKWVGAAYSRLASPRPLSDGVRTNFLGQTPNRLVQIAVPLAALSVGLPWIAVELHNAMVDGRLGNLTVQAEWTTALAVIGSLIGFLRSLFKGITTPSGAETPTGRALELVRHHVAPFLAVTLFTLIVFFVTAATTAAYITAASREQLGYFPLVFAIVVPVGLWAFGLTNVTTIHPYYRERLSYAFLEHSGAGDLRLAELDPNQTQSPNQTQTQTQKAGTTRPTSRRGRGPEGQLPAKIPGYVPRAETPASGQEPPRRPNLVLMATANIAEGDVLPSGRGGTPFVLGADLLGLSEPTLPGGACWVPTAEYRTDPSGPVRLLHLAKAMAISGAAFAPRAGRESKLIGVYRLLLAFANLRLGVWMPNPYYPNSRSGDRDRSVFSWLNERMDRPTSLAVVAEAFGSMPVRAPYLYLTDGGHYDNSGLVESLRRHPDRLVVLDGSGDDEDKFPVVGDAMSTLRMDHGIEVRFDPTRLVRGTDTHPRAGHVKAEATDPHRPGWKCDITYIKCVLPEGLPWDLEAYRLRNPDFPATTQRFEMFDEFDFEAYRKLGECLVDRAIEAGDLW